MRILLLGEFSRLHNSLKEGLISLGHDVTIAGSGDDFKQFPVDFFVASKIIKNNKTALFLNRVAIKLFKFDFQKLERAIRFLCFLPKMKNYDVVQIINSDAIETFPWISMLFYKKLMAQNKRFFLLICGDETPIIEHLLKNEVPYSVLTPLIENRKLEKKFSYSLKYVTPQYRKLYEFIKKNCDAILVSDLDYKIPMESYKTKIHFVANPINVDKIQYVVPSISNKIVIFHGKNKHSYLKKGSYFFEEALSVIQQKYPNKVEIIITDSLPYIEYQKYIDKAHIVLDQVYSWDQGYNALEAMAKGKVVFSGAEKEFIAHYKLNKIVAINALPDVTYLVNELSILIEDPHLIQTISENARQFVTQKHHYITQAEKYLNVWENFNLRSKY